MQIDWKLKKVNWRVKKPVTKREKIGLGIILGIFFLFIASNLLGAWANHFVIIQNGYMPVTTKDTSFTISPPYVAVNTITGDTYTALGQKELIYHGTVMIITYCYINPKTKYVWLSDIFIMKNKEGKVECFSIGDALQDFILIAWSNGYR